MQIVWLLFVLLVLAGLIRRWQALRRNPVFTVKGAIQSGTVLLLGVALSIVLVLQTANHLPRQSPALIVLCCAGLIAAVTLGLIAASIRITDGPIAQPPPATIPESVHRSKVYPWLNGSALALLLLLAWAALVAPTAAEIPLCLAAVLLVSASSALGGYYIQARRSDYAMAALTTYFWVHWQYAIGQPDAWLGSAGLLWGDAYTPWLASGNYLIEARVERMEGLSLILTFRKYSGRGFVTVTIRVPIPEGRENEAELLEAKLRARCPKARVHFEEAYRAAG